MRIAVLNGSPKGNISVTVQYVLFLRKKFPQHEFVIFNVAQEINKIEKDTGAFRGIVEAVQSSDLVLWVFPLYVLLVPSQYKRFIELIWERDARGAFEDKYAAALSTSIHFYDHTAQNYVNAVCDDLGMRYVGGYPAHMYDLMHRVERARFTRFAEHTFEAVEIQAPVSRKFPPLVRGVFRYVPGEANSKVDVGGKKVLLLADCRDGEPNLHSMIERLLLSFSGSVEQVNLYDVDIKGGCLGCLQCGYDNRCAYGDKDGYREFFDTKVRTADIIVLAGAMKDRYLSSRWKMFFDRAFFNGHTPTLAGKQVGIILSGPLGQDANLRQILEAYWEIQGANLVDIVTDESEDPAEIDSLLQSMAERLLAYAREEYVRPGTFLTVGGWKLFRDEIWSNLRLAFQADHRYYKEHGLYDFPQKQYKMRLTNTLVAPLFRIPMVRQAFAKRIKEGMIQPLQKVLEQV
jgi:multimeric flavodoxin WrbA